MSLLAWLTLGWVAALVLALAVSLTAIALYLQRTGSLLAEARDALEVVRDRTEPLEEPLKTLSEVTGEMAADFEELTATLRDEEGSQEPESAPRRRTGGGIA